MGGCASRSAAYSGDSGGAVSPRGSDGVGGASSAPGVHRVAPGAVSSTAAAAAAAAGGVRQPVRLPCVHHEAVSDVCWWTVGGGGSDIGALLLASDVGGGLTWMDASSATASAKHAAHEAAVNAVSVCSSAALVATASRDKTVRLWRASWPEEADSAAAGASLCAPARSARSFPSLTPAAALSGHTLTVSAVTLSADGTRVATGSRDTTVRLWDVASGAAIYRGQRAQNLVTCLKWYPSAGSAGGSQNVLVQGSEDLRVRLWDVRVSMKEVQALEGYVYFPLDLDVSPCGRYILTSSKGFNGVGAEARLWDLRAMRGRPVEHFDFSSTPLSADELPASGCAQIQQFTGHMQDTTGCAFVPRAVGGQHVFVTASKDGSVRVWSTSKPTSLAQGSTPRMESYTGLSVLPGVPPAPYDAYAALIAAGTVFGNVHVYGLTEDARLELVAASVGATSTESSVSAGVAI